MHGEQLCLFGTPDRPSHGGRSGPWLADYTDLPWTYVHGRLRPIETVPVSIDDYQPERQPP